MNYSRLFEAVKNTWTDHNPSDPGVTLLDNLLYALSDLGYRIAFKVPDILAEQRGANQNALPQARRALTVAPLSFTDYRKRIIDLEGVNNAFIRENKVANPILFYAGFAQELILEEQKDELLPNELYQRLHLKGLLEVQLIPEEGLGGRLEHTRQGVEEALHKERTICTDFTQIQVSNKSKVRILLDIEVGEETNLVELEKDILDTIDQYLSPKIPFQGLRVFEEDKLVEVTFDGPALDLGFLGEEDLKGFHPRSAVRRSDLIQELMRFQPRLKVIRSLRILIDDAEEDVLQEWIFDLPNPSEFDRSASSLTFYRNGIKGPEVESIRDGQSERASASNPALDYPKPGGRNRNIGRYTSVRTHLPEVFGVGPSGLPGNASITRKAQANQLSTYLLFFEQILANAFVQLSNAHRFFDPFEDTYRTYFSLELGGLNGGPEGLAPPSVEDIFTDASDTDRGARLAQLVEGYAQGLERTNRFLDHLLARYGESFQSYSLVQGISEQTIADKRLFLQEFTELSSRRHLGQNYTTESFWNTAVVTGLKKRIARKLGISEDRRYFGAQEEGFFLVENILLRPQEEDIEQEEALMGYLTHSDPYSFQISYVFPKSVGRFRGKGFKALTEQMLRAETPAHIRYKIYWLDQESFSTFQHLFHDWLEQLYQSTFGSNDDGYLLKRLTRDELIDFLFCACEEEDKRRTFGLTFPNRNLPLEVKTFDNGNTTTATITIKYPQRNATYSLFDREFKEKGEEGNLEENEGFISIKDRQLVLIDEGLQQDETYNIRAIKSLSCRGRSYGLRPVFLHGPVRANVNIFPRTVKVVCEGTDYTNLNCDAIRVGCEEINYKTTAHILICDIQAEVNYYLFSPGSDTPFAGPSSGNEGEHLILEAPSLTEDLLIRVQARRGNTGQFTYIGEVSVRVRANPNINFLGITSILVFGDSSNMRLVGNDGNGNLTQSSVSYTMYKRDIRDREFVHQKAPENQPPDEELWRTPRIKIHRPFVTLEEITAPRSPYTLVGPNQPTQDGEELVFGSGSLEEDTLFVVVASKEGHETPVILGSPVDVDPPSRAHIGAALVKPNPNIPYLVNSPVSPPDTFGQVRLPAPQLGVMYCLKYRVNGALQMPVYVHVTEGAIDNSHPRRDGVGLSKVAVDTVVGSPAPLPVLLSTRNELTATRTMQIIAEKIQTGIQEQIGGDFDIVVNP